MGIPWLWTRVIDLPWWGTILCFIYCIYCLGRAFYIWATMSESEKFWSGCRRVFFGYSKQIQLYHIVRAIIDIPAVVLGLLLPVLKAVLAFKLHTFKEPKQESSKLL